MNFIEKAIARRIIVTVSGGCVTSITAEGIDLAGVTAFLVDFDNEDDENAVNIGGDSASLDELVIEPEGDAYSADFCRAFGNWIFAPDWECPRCGGADQDGSGACPDCGEGGAA